MTIGCYFEVFFFHLGGRLEGSKFEYDKTASIPINDPIMNNVIMQAD